MSDSYPNPCTSAVATCDADPVAASSELGPIEYRKTSGPVTAHEVLALTVLNGLDLLPSEPITPEQLLAILRGLPDRVKEEFVVFLSDSPDEGSGVIEALTVVVH